jgi:hypothetical protein
MIFQAYRRSFIITFDASCTFKYAVAAVLCYPYPAVLHVALQDHYFCLNNRCAPFRLCVSAYQAAAVGAAAEGWKARSIPVRNVLLTAKT